MLFACVLECSSIGAMVFLALFVVITRIGVNKEPPPKPDEPGTSPGSDTIPS
jgi:hypothetical protein